RRGLRRRAGRHGRRRRARPPHRGRRPRPADGLAPPQGLRVARRRRSGDPSRAGPSRVSGTPPVAPRGARALARRILAFAGVPFLSLLAPFLFLPVLARLAGADAWVAIALGQSVGGFAALIGGVGYPTLAPPQVALADQERRRRIL